jgi:penicillin amidase
MDMLEEWDRRLSADSAAAAVFEVFVSEWLNLALADDLGQDLLLYFNGSTAGYTAEDVLLEHPGSALWDRADTPEWETPEKILEEALVRAIEYLEAELGRNPDRWSWGRLHRYYFRHSGATSRFEAWLLNRGPYPAPGDGNTVNPGYYAGFPGYYDVFWISSLRMIAPLGDIDGTLVVAPMGQSGQPGHPHYDDMIVPWLEGQYASLPLSRGAVEVIAVQRLVLRP